MLTILAGGGINWTWYLECELHDDDTVTIVRHYRMHDDRDANHPKTSAGFRIIEAGMREAVAVSVEKVEKGRIIAKRYEVRNVKNVFAYD